MRPAMRLTCSSAISRLRASEPLRRASRSAGWMNPLAAVRGVRSLWQISAIGSSVSRLARLEGATESLVAMRDRQQERCQASIIQLGVRILRLAAQNDSDGAA